VIVHSGNPFLVSTMSATVVSTSCFDTVTDNSTAAMVTLGSERVNGALEAVEIMRDTVYHYLEALLIIVAANFACLHNFSMVSWSVEVRAAAAS
jgi:hypothetical protein